MLTGVREVRALTAFFRWEGVVLTQSSTVNICFSVRPIRRPEAKVPTKAAFVTARSCVVSSENRGPAVLRHIASVTAKAIVMTIATINSLSQSAGKSTYRRSRARRSVLPLL